MTRALHVVSRVLSGDDTLMEGFLKMFSANRFTIIPFIKQTTDPEVKREQRREEKEKNEEIQDHEGTEPTSEEAANAISEYITMSQLSKVSV